MIYVYGITEPDARVPDVEGLDDRPLSLLKVAKVAGLYSHHQTARFEPEPEALWRHDRVIDSAMRSGPVLPARFGTTFGDPTALGNSLQAIQSRLALQLDRVRGCVELAVRVLPPEEAISVARTGNEYVQFKLARHQERRALVEQTLVPLAAHAVQSRTSTLDADHAAMTASYLVRAGEVDHFAEQVRLLAQSHAQLSFSCTGPWPPYSFVEDDGARDE